MKRLTLPYIERAQENCALVDGFSSATATSRGWQVTLFFYASIYWVKAYYAEYSVVDPASHHKRLRHARQDIPLQPVADDLAELQVRSENARYTLFPITEQDFIDAQLAFAHLQSTIARLLDPLNPPSPIPEHETAMADTDAQNTVQD